MDVAILLKMSGLINQYSTVYEASVPRNPVTYAKLVNGKLVCTKCKALRIARRGKHKNHVRRSLWFVYEIDIDKVICQISRHNAGLIERVNSIDITAQDVDIIVRRASYQRLRLQLVPSAFFISGNGMNDH